MKENSRYINYLESKSQAKEDREKNELIRLRDQLCATEAELRTIARENERMDIQLRMKDVTIRALEQQLESAKRAAQKI